MGKKICSMVEECVEIYKVTEKPDGSAEIYIKVPKRFKDLWIVKLSDLMADEDEIKEYEPEDYGESY